MSAELLKTPLHALHVEQAPACLPLPATTYRSTIPAATSPSTGSAAQVEARGAAAAKQATYRLHYTLSKHEVDAQPLARARLPAIDRSLTRAVD
jgi:hypothetical protein